MKQSVCDRNIKAFQGKCNCISMKDSESEGFFTWHGCDIKHVGSDLGNNVYEVQGYNPITKEIEELGNICAQCLCYISNSDIPDFIDGHGYNGD